jgi:hypothetical protein
MMKPLASSSDSNATSEPSNVVEVRREFAFRDELLGKIQKVSGSGGIEMDGQSLGVASSRLCAVAGHMFEASAVALDELDVNYGRFVLCSDVNEYTRL